VQAAQFIREALQKNFEPLLKTAKTSPKKLLSDRMEKFRKIGAGALAHAPVNTSQ
jgi:acetyl-CoA carboxylase alpha subunit